MEVMLLLLFVGAVFVGLSIWAFGWTVTNEGFEHNERLAVLPLDEPTSSPTQGEAQ